MNYKEQLLNIKWQKVKTKILKRDQNKCQICENSSIIKKSKSGELKRIQLMDNKVLALLNRSDPRYRLFKPKYYVDFQNSEKSNDLEGEVYIFNWYNHDELKSLKGATVFYNFENNESNLGELVINGIKLNDRWYHVNNLHIHHTYYKENLKAWEYPTETLQTLCWLCHEKLHKDKTIPILDKNDIEIGKKKFCLRCYGAGCFPQYSHIDNGICFRCNGKRFEI